MIYLCQTCCQRVDDSDTETVYGQYRVHNRIVENKFTHKKAHCGGIVDPIEPSKGDDPTTYADRIERRVARFLQLLTLNAPEMVLNEERRMIREAAEQLCTFNPKTDDTKVTLQ